ncbi:Elf-1_N domain-containing protein [Caenorhabditis elegans]|uniref:Elf-1_N domain-containing protein n=1 Tax=Caenorhabditis elegans TaxID=6239 RepID=I2HA88_CAEEL|nr:Elf-1_N domain-containing protein [Caenorhabditis elegans]CCH63795.1 Elf-1_N domain-containing protein [Caenorhabditis elegans]|eukprot:NP_001250941.1 Uncharacterized protein CELE_F53B6.13 [Caenorhabditis elegans]
MKEELAKEHSDIFFPDELIFVESPEGSADLENMGDLTEKTGGEGTSGAPASS